MSKELNEANEIFGWHTFYSHFKPKMTDGTFIFPINNEVATNAKPNYIWSVLHRSGNYIAVPGRHWDHVAFLVTEKPWFDKDQWLTLKKKPIYTLYAGMKYGGGKFAEADSLLEMVEIIRNTNDIHIYEVTTPKGLSVPATEIQAYQGVFESESGHWTASCQILAFKQGWGIFTNTDKAEIQRVDEFEIFDSDEEALEFVCQQAYRGNWLAQYALIEVYSNPTLEHYEDWATITPNWDINFCIDDPCLWVDEYDFAATLYPVTVGVPCIDKGKQFDVEIKEFN